MKEIRGSASAVVRAPAQKCYALLAAVDRYDEWNRDLVRELEVLQREPLRLRAAIHVKRSQFAKTFELRVAVSAEPPWAVYITRIANEPSDPERLRLAWRITPAREGTQLQLDLNAVASFVPRLMPLRSLGNTIARKLLGSATEALDQAGSAAPQMPGPRRCS